MTALLGILLLAAVVWGLAQRWQNRRLLQRLNAMLDDALQGQFCTQHYNEDLLSAVESRMAQLLAANELGLGGCMIASFSAGELKMVLGLEDFLKPQLVLALGAPMEVIRITDVGSDGNTTYYRDEKGTHYVPKRTLEELILK